MIPAYIVHLARKPSVNLANYIREPLTSPGLCEQHKPGLVCLVAAVGTKAPSLYKHYKNKQAIFNAIFEEMQRRYDAEAVSMSLHIPNAAEDDSLFTQISADALIERIRVLVAYSLHDEFVSQFRRLMTIEQFRSRELAALYTERYVTRMLGYHEELFRRLIQNGTLRSGDACSMAWQFVSPIFVQLSVCDRQPEKEQEAMDQLAAHVRQFYAVYQEEDLQ